MIFLFASEVLTIGNAVAVIGFVLAVGGAWIILRSRGLEEAHRQTKQLAENYRLDAERIGRLKASLEAELKEALAERDRARDEAQTFETAYKALGGINIRELLNLDTIKRERDAFEKECIDLQRKLARQHIEEAGNVREG